MAYNYAYPYNSQPMTTPYGMNNFQPMSNIGSQNQPALNPFYQASFQSNNQRFSAFFVNDYSEVKNATVSADGSPTLFMMNNKDVFYIKKVGEDGRTILKSYSFVEYTDEDVAEKNSNSNDSNKKEIENMKNEINQLKLSLNELVIALTSNTKTEQSNNDNKGEVKNVQKFTTNDF